MIRDPKTGDSKTTALDGASDPSRRRFLGMFGGAAATASISLTPGGVRKGLEHIIP